MRALLGNGLTWFAFTHVLPCSIYAVAKIHTVLPYTLNVDPGADTDPYPDPDPDPAPDPYPD